MKILNPPSPYFSKGGLGGFESYFLGNSKFKYHISKLSVWNIWILIIRVCLVFRASNLEFSTSVKKPLSGGR